MEPNALQLTHAFLRRHVPRGGFCIDATAGRGRDTALLCQLVGPRGHVLAFDIQPEAVQCTRALVAERGYGAVATVLQRSHSRMADYAGPGQVDAIVFNFGYLPGGDKRIFTRAESSLAAVGQGLGLLRPGGVMSLCIYYGGPNGYAERDALLAALRRVDSRRYSVLLCDYCNRPGDPPLAAFVVRDA